MKKRGGVATLHFTGADDGLAENSYTEFYETFKKFEPGYDFKYAPGKDANMENVTTFRIRHKDTVTDFLVDISKPGWNEILKKIAERLL